MDAIVLDIFSLPESSRLSCIRLPTIFEVQCCVWVFIEESLLCFESCFVCSIHLKTFVKNVKFLKNQPERKSMKMSLFLILLSFVDFVVAIITVETLSFIIFLFATKYTCMHEMMIYELCEWQTLSIHRHFFSSFFFPLPQTVIIVVSVFIVWTATEDLLFRWATLVKTKTMVRNFRSDF